VARCRGSVRVAWAVWAALAAAMASGCGREGGVGSAEGGFLTTAQEIDFGKALLGQEVRRSLPVVSTGRVPVTVRVETSDPFRAQSSIAIPAGATVPLEITFVAGDGPAENTLQLSSGGKSYEVALRGRGVRPLDCRPSVPCRVARFDLESESCVESVAEESAACTPESRCLENGFCVNGTCLGMPRRCDDRNACTSDSCSPDVGCVHEDVSSKCPQPTNPCEVASCSPSEGCGTRSRGDFAVCGPVDCVRANLCVLGSCHELPTPEGFLCAPATPCQGEGHCTGGECVRPDAGTLKPEWSVALGTPSGPVTPEPARMATLSGNVFFPLCGLASQDGGCGLVSYTRNGFLRFERPVSPGDSMHGVSASGVVMSGGGDLLALATANGDVLWKLPLDGGEVASRGVAIASNGEIFAAASWADAGGGAGGVAPPAGAPASVLARIASDGGVLSIDEGRGAVVALDPSDAPVVLGPEGAVSFAVRVDGGFAWASFDAGSPEPRLSLGGGGQFALVGGRVAIPRDGRAPIALLADDSGEEPAGIDVLSRANVAYAFFRSCRAPAPTTCAPLERGVGVRAVALQGGAELWQATVLPSFAPGSVIEAALTGGPLAGGVLTLTEANLDGGIRSDVQLFFQGERAMLCQLDGTPRVHGAVFDQSALFVLVERAGEWRIEAFDLPGITLSTSGWSRPSGASAMRRERP
jgi:Dictyostelium (slime mold) repeat